VSRMPVAICALQDTETVALYVLKDNHKQFFDSKIETMAIDSASMLGCRSQQGILLETVLWRTQ